MTGRGGPIRIGTRGSQLALAQASELRARLMAAHGLAESDFDIQVITTAGDRIQDRPLSEVGGKGLFTLEIEGALIDGRIDLAVHSAKDVATVLPQGLHLAAFLPREDVRDAFIGRGEVRRVADLPQGAVVGSASLRRQALLKRMRPDLEVINFRGNVPTRLRKLNDGAVDGTLLALAGMKRLALEAQATEIFPEEEFPPAPGQGAIAVESRIGDRAADKLLAAIDHRETHLRLRAERAFLAELDGSCRTPIAACSSLEADRLHFFGTILTPDGAEAHEVRLDGPATAPEALGREAGARLLAQAGPDFFAGWADEQRRR